MRAEERGGRDDAQQLRKGIRALVRRFALSERADVACCGMTVAQAATLEVLKAEGAIRLSALGKRLGIAPSTLTRNLARLVEAGLVVRSGDDEDARVAQVALSEQGRAAAARLEVQEHAFNRTILDRIPASRRAASVRALSDILRAVREATESCCPGAFDHLMTDFPRGSREGKGCDDASKCR
jgi:DNA-binding MarR family transcriptional regulator